ncbi:polyketide synthase-like protein [Nemania sp. FL0916]|nr:polyketide synthase-like protein [Nemania sp. FL0916]
MVADREQTSNRMADSTIDTSGTGNFTPDSNKPVHDDPICVVGMGCRLPGGIRSPSGLWDLLMKNSSARCSVPRERFNIKGFHAADGRNGAMVSDGGYFLQEDVRNFDNSFFGISNIEARYMDPQQRKLLEVTYECFENAGVSLDNISGTNTGVFVGNFTIDHQTMQMRDPDTIHRYTATGSGTAILANRISHVFNLQGPSFTLDTACSSSIYCLHTAVNAIRAGDCDSAIVASVNLITSPEQFLATSKAGVLSPTSTCHTFDSSADGYGRAEAVNCIYLKRFTAARSNGDKIWAVVRGTAVNSNGKTPGITQPSADLQNEVIHKAFANANLCANDVDYLECHGTGTPVGDPIEIDAIGRWFSPRVGPPLYIGAVKTNLGHSEAASGLTSIIKIALAFQHDLIPPTYGVKKLNPKLGLESLDIEVVTCNRRWPRTSRRACLNSFGYGGANAHAIFESVDSFMSQESLSPNHNFPRQNSQFLCLPVTAASIQSLETRVLQISRLISSCKLGDLENIAYSLACRMSHFNARKVIIIQLSPARTTNSQQIDLISDVPEGGKPLDLAFVFTGQGAQYADMGKELLRYEAFRNTVGRLNEILQALPSPPSWTIQDIMLGVEQTSDINNATVSQTTCTALQVALVDLLRSWNLMPAAVVGHSSGEIAAAYAAGLLTAKQSILTAYFRGCSVDRIEKEGGMLAVGAEPTLAENLIREKGLGDQVCIACINAPDSVTLSGPIKAIALIEADFQQRGTFVRKLKTGGRAYHSHMMKEIGAEYERLLQPVFEETSNGDNRTTSVTMYSSSGLLVEESVATGCTMSARYWRNNLENPVQFLSAVTRLMKMKPIRLIEIGPHSLLKGPIKKIRASLNIDDNTVSYAATLIRNENADLCMKQLASSLFLQGYSLPWNSVNTIDTTYRTHCADLPPYSWDYSSAVGYHEPQLSVELRHREYPRHPLLGSQYAGQNCTDKSWRNTLQLNELPWLSDHKFSGRTIFPVAAYLAMVMEGLRRIEGFQDPLPSFEFRNVGISAALSVGESSAQDSRVMLYTNISPRRLSTATTSISWYDFTIASSTGNTRIVNCAGTVRVRNSSPMRGTVLIEENNDTGTESAALWYDAFRADGLEYGRHFQSIRRLFTSSEPVATGACTMWPSIAGEGQNQYPVHPTAIDACLQIGIMSSALGDVGSLRAYLPTFIEECLISPGDSHGIEGQEAELEGYLHAQSSKTSFSTQRVDCTLRNSREHILVRFSGARMALYEGRMVKNTVHGAASFKRHPCLRVKWKPDIQMLRSDLSNSLRSYIETFKSRQKVDMLDDERLAVVGALIDLAGHKNPQLQVVELGENCDCKSKHWIELLDAESPFPRFGTWKRGTLDKDGGISIDGKSIEDCLSETLFDVLIVAGLDASEDFWSRSPSRLTLLLGENGIVITRKTAVSKENLAAAGFEVTEMPRNFILAKQSSRGRILSRTIPIIVVVRGPSEVLMSLVNSLTTYLQQSLGIADIPVVPLDQIASADLDEKTTCISFVEMEEPFLPTMNQRDMDLFRSITNKVGNLVWVTGANSLANPNPNLTLANGLSRALMLEQPALCFTLVDIGLVDQLSPLDIQHTCKNLETILGSMSQATDKEFAQFDGMLYISRFGPDQHLNTLFQKRYDSPGSTHMCNIDTVKPVQISLGRNREIDTIHFQQIREPRNSYIPPGLVEIDIKAIGLNAKDVYTMRGRTETRTGTSAMEFAGIVTAVGANETDLQPGDRVVVAAPIHFATTTCVPTWAAHKLLPHEDFTTMASLPIAYCTALYALHDRANLRATDTILIHSGAGAFGIAAIATALRIGATVYTTVGSMAKREFLTATLGIPPSHIFNSRDDSFAEGIHAATNGRGVDVVINSLTGDLLHASWSCIANFGRFIEIGKQDLVNAGRLDMSIFSRNATFTAFDMSELFFHESPFYRNILASKMRELLSLYRSGNITELAITRFDIANVTQAYRHFSAQDRVGKIVISLEDPHSVVPVSFSTYLTLFDSEKVYLLVGCLGGLGRSLSRWMVQRGARHLVFLGKSGSDKPAAKELVASLRALGVHVVVVRGDVASVEDTVEAVKHCRETGRTIGGVVQGAMGLCEGLFSQMSSEGWSTVIQPKVTGTWNLHNALANTDVEFMLLLSSVSGSVGTATESNYCAANGFLDSFARWRQAQGKRTVSVGLGMISEVGYLHENPEIEKLLLRRGIQSLNEKEFLQMIDLALSGTAGTVSSGSGLEAAHLLTGLEPSRVLELKGQGFDVSHGIMQDPRTAILSAAMERELGIGAAPQGRSHAAPPVQDIPWASALSSSILSVLVPVLDAPSLEMAILRLARKRFSDMILLHLDQIDDAKPLSKYGVDSMIASEFRTWVWTTFQIDVPFLDLMSQDKTLQTLAGFIERGLLAT